MIRKFFGALPLWFCCSSGRRGGAGLADQAADQDRSCRSPPAARPTSPPAPCSIRSAGRSARPSWSRTAAAPAPRSAPAAWPRPSRTATPSWSLHLAWWSWPRPMRTCRSASPTISRAVSALADIPFVIGDRDQIQDPEGADRRRQEARRQHPLRHRGRRQLRPPVHGAASGSPPDIRRRTCRSAARRRR